MDNTFIEIHRKDVHNKIYVENDTVNSVFLKNNYIIHKQIEYKNGFTYMRMKKRGLTALS